MHFSQQIVIYVPKINIGTDRPVDVASPFGSCFHASTEDTGLQAHIATIPKLTIHVPGTTSRSTSRASPSLPELLVAIIGCGASRFEVL